MVLMGILIKRPEYDVSCDSDLLASIFWLTVGAQLIYFFNDYMTNERMTFPPRMLDLERKVELSQMLL